MRTLILKTVKATSLAVLAAATLSACGGKTPSLFRDANFSTYQNGQEQHVVLSTEIGSENVIFTGITLPVRNGNKVIGSLAVSTDLAAKKSLLVLDLNLSSLVNVPVPTMGATLPNGTVWPIAGVDLSRMMMFDIGNNGSRAYLYYDAQTRQTLLGAAVNVEGLSLGTPANLFSVFDTGKISGLAGLYFGPGANQSGVGFIADASKTFGARSGASFISTGVSKSVARKIAKQLQQLNSSSQSIDLH